MKSNKLALIALLLWVITMAVVAWYFIRGNTAAGTDGRTAIVLRTAERDMILSEMRGLLSATQVIIDGVNQPDRNRIIQSSRSVGMGAAADVNPALMAKFPLAFKTLAFSVHREMDDIAKAAETGKPVAELLTMMSNVLVKCNACHASWQIKAGD